MDNNQKKFNIYVFLSTFSRNLIEVFIPIILYKYGYNLSQVILYYLLVNIFSLIISYPCIYFSKKYSNKLLSLVGIMSFIFVQILLNNITYNIIYLYILAFLYTLYRRGYWIPRRFYNLKVIHKNDISKSYSIISIMNQIAIIISSYIGSLFLDFINIKTLTIISIILFLLSLIPLYKLDFNHEKNDIKLDFFTTIKKIPFRDLYLFGSYELSNIIKFFFPLYLFIYVKDTYQTIGIINLFTNLSTIIFTYIYGKKINKNKNYLNISIILVTLVYIFKANTTSYLLILIAFLEGISTKMYELSINKEFYSLSKKFEYENYNLVYEIVQNTFRTFILLICYLFINDLKYMIYITLIFILVGSFIKFKYIKDKNFKI